VPVLQKDLVAEANRRGKLVVVATQMLESMIHSSTPTRAEATDVANAILDGTDAVMLSGETAVGEYPVASVATMARIVAAAERSSYYPSGWVDLSLRRAYAPHSVCEAAATASADFGAVPVVVFTLSGDTALYLSKIRNQSPIYAFSPSRDVVAMLSLAWNVTAFGLRFGTNHLSLQREAERILLQRRVVRRGQHVVMVSGTGSMRGMTSSMRIKRIGVD
jgi:pyruvate kinase